MDLPEDIEINKEGVEKLRESYGPMQTDPGLPEKFLFVPAQLDEDTSITISSPVFKNCDSFMGALRHFIPNTPVVVRNHPKFAEKSRSPDIFLYEGPLTSLELALQSTIVAGITSTVLTEALIHGKPVASFGCNVGMSAHLNPLSSVMPSAAGIFEKMKGICERDEEFSPPRSAEEILSWLLSKQWDGGNIPNWVVEYVESRT
jgi:hypothetical protein